jgi:hypothetical protein
MYVYSINSLGLIVVGKNNLIDLDYIGSSSQRCDFGFLTATRRCPMVLRS